MQDLKDKFDLGLEVAQELGLTEQYLSGNGWRDFTPKEMFRFAQALAARKEKEDTTQQLRLPPLVPENTSMKLSNPPHTMNES